MKKEPQSENTVKTQNARYTVANCPACDTRPSLDVLYPGGEDSFPEYQFVCWLDNIYGNASCDIVHAAASWNEIVDAPQSVFVPDASESATAKEGGR